MRHTRADASLRACRRRIAAHERRRRRDGFAPWAVIARADGRLIGLGGLLVDPLDPDWGPEIAYFLHPSVWGRGLATELVAAALALADGMLRLPCLIAFAHAENAASRRVLEKSGFVAERFVPAMDRALFRRPAGRAAAPGAFPDRGML